MMQNIPGADVIISLDIPWADIIILLAIVTSCVIGWFRGFIKEMLSLFVWVCGVVIAGKYCQNVITDYPRINEFLTTYVSNYHIKIAIIFALLFVLILIIGGMVNFILNKIITFTGLASTDKTLGLAFGLGRGVLVMSMVVLLLVNSGMHNMQALQNSHFIPPLNRLGSYASGNFAKIYSSYEDDLKAQYEAIL